MMLLLLAWGCKNPCDKAPGCLLAEDLDAAMLSVRVGPGEDDVWIVGASDGSGPVALHLEADEWIRLDTGDWEGSELWWAWIDADEAVLVGNDGLILEVDRDRGAITAVEGIDAGTTFFGVWGADATDLWAVGQSDGGEGPPALWRRLNGEWAAFADGPGEEGGVHFKVHGTATDDAWIVGNQGSSLHWDGASWTPVPTDAEVDTANAPLLTIDVGGERPFAVGGAGNALVLEYDGSDWRDATPDFQPPYNGVCTGASTAWAVGANGARAEREDGAWISDTERELTPMTAKDWHACAIDAGGGLWTVGGRISSRPLVEGVVGYQGKGRRPEIDL